MPGKLNEVLEYTRNDPFGFCGLDGAGKIFSAQLPAYVDDVIEVANFAALPVTGESDIIYVTLDDNKTYRWSGSAYVEISVSLVLGETSSTAYRGDRGKVAFDHSQLTTGNPHAVNKTDVGLSNVDNTADEDKPLFTAITPGLVPLSGGDPTNYLNAAGGWNDPAGAGSLGNHASFTLNSNLSPPPIGNQMRMNSATPSAVTEIYVSTTDTTGLDVSLGLDRIKVGYQVYLQDFDDSTKWVIYTLIADSIDNGSYYTLPVGFHKWGGTALPFQKIEMQPISPGSVGIPAGGASGDYLRKSSVLDYAVAWHTITAATVGLGNVDNTSDADKPVSTAQDTINDALVAAIDDLQVARTRIISATIGDGTNVITTGVKGYLPRIPYAGTIVSWALIADVSGSIVIDVWKAAGAVPVNGDSITASAKPTLSTDQEQKSSTLTGWTTAVAIDDCFAFEVESATTVKQVTLILEVTT